MVVLFTILVLSVNLLVDLSYASIDPAARTHESGFSACPLAMSASRSAPLLLLFVGCPRVDVLVPPTPSMPADGSKLQPASAAWLARHRSSRPRCAVAHHGRCANLAFTVGLIAVAIGMTGWRGAGAWAAARGGGWSTKRCRPVGPDLRLPAVLIAILITSVLGASAQNAILAIAIFTCRCSPA